MGHRKRTPLLPGEWSIFLFGVSYFVNCDHPDKAGDPHGSKKPASAFGLRPFARADIRHTVEIAAEAAWSTDKGGPAR